MGVGGTVSDIYTQRSAVPQVSTYDNLPQSEQRLILIAVSKIIRAYRNYRKRIILCNGIINQNYATQRSGAFQTASFDYTGGKDERGLKHGFGIQKWRDGTKYVGEFVHNKAVGYGKFYHPDGDIYMGEFSNDRANGYGEYYHENGAVYHGSWCDDSQVDVGYEIWSDSSKYNGTYSNGKKHGIGTYVWQDGTKYEGEWKENNIEGYGIYYFSDGREYIGQWKNNQMHGYGEFRWKEGKRYYGYYKNDKKNGFGMYYWPDDKFYIGFWRDGKQHGYGKYMKGNAVKYGLWVDGKKEKWLANEKELFDSLEQRDKKYIDMFKIDMRQMRLFMEIKV